MGSKTPGGTRRSPVMSPRVAEPASAPPRKTRMIIQAWATFKGMPDWARTSGAGLRLWCWTTRAARRWSSCSESNDAGAAKFSPTSLAAIRAVSRSGTSFSISATRNPSAATGTAHKNTTCKESAYAAVTAGRTESGSERTPSTVVTT